MLKSKCAVKLNQLGATAPVRVRVTPKDWDDAVAEAAVARVEGGDVHAVRSPLERGLARVLNPRYVARVGRVPAPAGGAAPVDWCGSPLHDVTLTRYVGRKLDPAPAFVVALTNGLIGASDPNYLASRWTLHLQNPAFNLYCELPREGRFTLPLPTKARRANPRADRRPGRATAAPARVPAPSYDGGASPTCPNL